MTHPLTRAASTLPRTQQTAAAATAQPVPNNAAPLMAHSLALRAASLAGALLATTVLLGSQLGLAVAYSQDAEARHLAAKQAQRVAQQAARPAPAQAGQAPQQASPVAVF